MSGMAGIFHLDGAPVDPELLYKMAQALQYRGKDGSKVWHDGTIGLVHIHFWTTPEEVGEEQPICSEDGRLWITADARVDNREELIPLLCAEGYLKKEVPSDVEIILAAYQRWGEDCAQRLIGDFSFAIWDAQARRLFLARDVIGIRQLYYAVMDEVFYFGNTIGAVLAALPRQPALNRPLIHEFLRGSYRRWICQTVYEDIQRLPPAHHLVVDGGVPKPKLYYVLGSGPVPRCTSDEDWLQAFRELFREAVRCRLRSITPIGISVSGGLDS
ncbi:MAG: asparagine synthetase B, partial [Chloroflexi bacterium]|nr:asparagine synthetase B [Chloroflexota bacterium]